MNKINQNPKTENFIQQMWDLLKNSSVKNHNSQILIDPQIMLKEAHNLVFPNKNNNDMNTLRIVQASSIVREEKDHVKEYIKQKISSNLFKVKRQISQQEKIEMQKQKNQLIKKFKQEKVIQQKMEDQMIQSARKFRKYQKVKNVPIAKIDSIMQKQSYINNHRQEFSISSKFNELTQNQSLPSNYNNQSYQNISNHNKYTKQDKIQYEDEQENELSFKNSILKQYQTSLQKKLRSYPKFIAVFKIILQKNLKISQKISSTASLVKQLSVKSISKKSEQQIKIYKIIPININNNLVKTKNLANILKGKNTKMIKLIEKQFDENEFICTMLVNKLIGQSNSFHIKRCMLMPNYIYYCEQSDVQQKKLKKIQLIPQQIEISQMRKQEGSIFNKKVENVDVVVIKGKDRKFIFEKDTLEGKEFLQELQILMTFKFYKANCLISETQNDQLEKFIKDSKQKEFSLTKNIIVPLSKYPFKNIRQETINNLQNMILKRSNIESIVIANCHLEQKQAMRLFKAFSNSHLIRKIKIVELKMTKTLLETILNILKTSTAPSFQLQLIQCQINDEIFVSQILNFKRIMNKLTFFNISKNQVTNASISQIVGCLSMINNLQIIELDLSNCPINDIKIIIQLLKWTPQLKRIRAEGCSFNFEEQNLKQLLKICHKNKIQKLQFKDNQPLCELSILSKSWKGEYPKVIELEVGRFSQKVCKGIKAETI